MNASNGTFQYSDVVITSVTDQSATRRKLETLSQQTIQVTFVISVILESLRLDSSNAFSEMSSLLHTIMQNNQLSQKINHVLQNIKGSNFVPLSVIDLVSDETLSIIIPLRTASPTLSPTPTDQEDNATFNLSGWNLVMVIVIPFFVIVVCLILLIATRKHNTKTIGKIAVIDVKSLSGIDAEEKKEVDDEREVSVKPGSHRVPPPVEEPSSNQYKESSEQNPPPNQSEPPKVYHSVAPQRVVLPPLQANQWNANPKSLRPQQSLDLEGGALSPLGSPKKLSPRPSSGNSHGSGDHGHGPALHNNPAAASVEDLLKLQSDLKDISSP